MGCITGFHSCKKVHAWNSEQLRVQNKQERIPVGCIPPACSLGGGSGAVQEGEMLLPPANEVWGKVIFLHPFVPLFTEGEACLSARWDTTPTPLGPCTPPPPGPCTPPGAEHAGRYGQCAGGTHPTGMQFCYDGTSPGQHQPL